MSRTTRIDYYKSEDGTTAILLTQMVGEKRGAGFVVAGEAESLPEEVESWELTDEELLQTAEALTAFAKGFGNAEN